MTRRAVYANVTARLSSRIEAASFEAIELCRHVFSCDKLAVLSEKPADPAQVTRLEELVTRRLSGEPLQYLVGSWDFYGRSFAVGPGVLIPRADTETLAEVVLSYLKGKKNARVLELCSGTGCLAVTVQLECPDASVTAVEKSEAAFSYLQENLRRHAAPVQAVLADALTLPPDGPWDVILANPPYLTAEEMRSLQPEVSYEPAMALDGGEDGLSFYRALTLRYAPALKPGGMLAYEIGMGQEGAVSEMLLQAGLKSVCQTRDLCGIIRTISGIRP